MRQCCGGKIVSIAQTCCGGINTGIAHNFDPSKRCCGTSYVPTNSLCCVNVIGQFQVSVLFIYLSVLKPFARTHELGYNSRMKLQFSLDLTEFLLWTCEIIHYLVSYLFKLVNYNSHLLELLLVKRS